MRFITTLVRVLIWLPLAIGALILASRAPNRPARAVPEGARARFDLVYQSDRGVALRLDVYEPATAETVARPRPTAIILHGGSWRGGSRVEMTDWAAAFVARGYVAVVPDYTLARPNAPSSDRALDDLRDAVRWTRDHASEFGSDPQRVVAFGVSAGGHLAALLGLVSQRLDPAARVQAVVDLYGPSDLVELLATTPARRDDLQLFLGSTPRDPSPAALSNASPRLLVRSNSPPMFLAHGTDDLWVPPEQSNFLHQALATARVNHQSLLIPHARHGFGPAIDGRDWTNPLFDFLQSLWDNPQPRQTPPPTTTLETVTTGTFNEIQKKSTRALQFSPRLGTIKDVGGHAD